MTSQPLRSIYTPTKDTTTTHTQGGWFRHTLRTYQKGLPLVVDGYGQVHIDRLHDTVSKLHQPEATLLVHVDMDGTQIGIGVGPRDCMGV